MRVIVRGEYKTTVWEAAACPGRWAILRIVNKGVIFVLTQVSKASRIPSDFVVASVDTEIRSEN